MSTRELDATGSRPASSNRNGLSSASGRSRPSSRNSERTDDQEMTPIPRLTVVEGISNKYKGEMLLNKYHGKGESKSLFAKYRKYQYSLSLFMECLVENIVHKN